MTSQVLKPYSSTEEWLNSISHGIGFVFSIVGLVLLIIRAKTEIAVISVSIYGASLILMFLASTTYHSLSNTSFKSTLKLIDHSAIYLLIAGTYTPFMLIALDNWMGIVGSIVIWSIALSGLFFKFIFGHKHPKISVAFYLLMGWLIVIFIYPLSQVVATNGLWLLMAGGFFFSIGVVFYVKKQIAYTHAIWHCFVMAGCACHFFAIYSYLLNEKLF